ncbi:hypothetical protein BC835DRAFT_1410906 [Cytidiella melzeri]|nr:hypothetical protein BC835DRAFT_1410906 [Cytidiella melzeri]
MQASVVQAVAVPAEHIPEKHRGVFSIDGSAITFDKGVPICNLPSVHFLQRIPDLFHHWNKSNLVMLNGHGVPVKHWDRLYKVRGAGVAQSSQWANARAEWANWKYIVEEMEHLGSESAFWAKYTGTDSSPMKYQAILALLKAARIARNVRDAQDARAYFGGNLGRSDANGVFEYKKGSRVYLAMKNEKNASAWQDLLARDAVVALNWYNMQPFASA